MRKLDLFLWGALVVAMAWLSLTLDSRAGGHEQAGRSSVWHAISASR